MVCEIFYIYKTHPRILNPINTGTYGEDACLKIAFVTVTHVMPSEKIVSWKPFLIQKVSDRKKLSSSVTVLLVCLFLDVKIGIKLNPHT